MEWRLFVAFLLLILLLTAVCMMAYNIQKTPVIDASGSALTGNSDLGYY
jgi:hypothetical protein